MLRAVVGVVTGDAEGVPVARVLPEQAGIELSRVAVVGGRRVVDGGDVRPAHRVALIDRYGIRRELEAGDRDLGVAGLASGAGRARRIGVARGRQNHK
jgi:hypothetical protein